jgi:Na+:H+ antiporter
MFRVLSYSVLLILGMVASQVPAIDQLMPEISALTMIFLAYIMIQVGMEFEIDKSRPRKYAIDYLVAMAAAAVPWLTAAAYFWWFFQVGINESLLIGRFAAPTSAGILFTMLAAAGLAATWTYKKARVLAIFDDLDTVLLMIPLKMMLIGFTLKLLGLGVVIVGLLAVAYYMMHWLRVPTNNFWIVGYAALVWGLCVSFDYVTDLHLEVLLPAFALGCLIKSDHLHGSAEFDPHARGPDPLQSRMGRPARPVYQRSVYVACRNGTSTYSIRSHGRRWCFDSRAASDVSYERRQMRAAWGLPRRGQSERKSGT